MEALRRDLRFILLHMPMSDIVPYKTEEEDLLKKLNLKDWSRSVSKEWVPGSQFVVDKPMNPNGGGAAGSYTGWWSNGTANGRGTWVQSDGKQRYDCFWVNGRMEGEAQFIVSAQLTPGQLPQVHQGRCAAGQPCDGFMSYHSDGVVWKWNSNEKKWKQWS